MTWRRGEAGSTLTDRPNDAPVYEWQGKGYIYPYPFTWQSVVQITTVTNRYEVVCDLLSSLTNCIVYIGNGLISQVGSVL